ncbi:transcriptional regulator [Sphingomonas sp.]|uniref:winged helix-turn-helix domain-containing protein n=1 Tax=Sphingomonas sp. TaxID=28214 RepID=UPI00286E5727|nr:transcriptional regulator [Sphingomonas sp.]
MYRIGKWTFEPEGGELSAQSEQRRLEHRAARTLELLCRADGGIVSRETLIAEVWGGRRLSENSVSVVIGQLRRALGDDPRAPRLIETVPKRGYRLRGVGPLVEAPPATSAVRRCLAVLAIVVIAAAALWLAGRAAPSAQPLIVAPVVNATGDAAYEPLARATGELLVTELSRRGYAVRSQPSAGDEPRLVARLVLWDGAPTLGLAVHAADGAVLWSAMASAAPGQVPAGVAAALDAMAETVPPERNGAGGRVARGRGRG